LRRESCYLPPIDPVDGGHGRNAAPPPAVRQADIERAGLVAAVEQSADAMVIAHPSGRIQYVNPAFTAMTGYSREEAVGQNPRILKSGLQSPEFYKELWDTVASGQVWHGELVNRRKDGTFYTEEMRITPVRDSGGEIVNYIAIKQDVTGRRAAEEAKRFLASIVESSEDAIVAHTPDGTILTWNQGAQALLGYSSEEIIGRHLSLLIPPEEQHQVRPFLEQILKSHGGAQREDLLVRKDGHRVSVSVTASSIRNFAGEVVAVSAIIRDITERKKADESRALLASIVESSDDAIVSLTLDGTILSWNKSAEVLFGYSADEVIGKDAAMLAPPDRLDELRRMLAMVRTGTVSRMDTVRLGKGGRRIEVAVTVSPIRRNGGEIVGAADMLRDISERVRAEQRLRESQERFRSAFENAPFGMCLGGLDGRLIQVNKTFCQLVGYSEQELLAASWTDLTHPDDLGPALRRRAQLYTDPDGCLDAELRYIHRTGNVVWVRARVSLVQNSDGSPLYFVVHVEDIGERKRAQEALRESEERFRIMADGCPAVMWVTNAKGGIQFINRAFRETCGVTFEQVEGSKWPSLFHPDDAPEYVEAFQRALKEHSPFQREARARRADGEWRWTESHAEPRFSPGGEFLGLAGISPDITEQIGRAHV
jgi:PAS domain S-box-containing protein